MHASSATSSTDLMVEKKKKVRRRRRRSCNGVDLISELPDHIIHHILSYLDMATVIQTTSCLSKRWRFLWESLPFLYFDERSNCSTAFCGRGGILHFVNHVIMLRNQNSNVQSFRFSFSHWDDYYELNDYISSWINNLIFSNVQVIDLQIHFYNSYFYFLELPKSLFTCKSLTTLKLEFWHSNPKIVPPFEIPSSMISLPALKTLHLQCLKLMNSAVELLISRSPVLETLIMKHCLLDTQELNICNPQIKSLTIERMKYKVESGPYKYCEINVFAPKLMSFSCTDFIGYINRYSIGINSSLVKAKIDIYYACNPSSYFMFKSDIYHAATRKNVIDCLTGICNVRSLMLSTWLLEFVTEVPDRLESLQINPFCNLSYLKLDASFSKLQIAAITYLLEKCPNLEHLVLKPTEVECWEPELAPQCMMHHLKLIEIWDVEASVNELEFLRFLLNNAIVLEKMIVLTSKQQSGNNCKRFTEFRKKLISFCGASSSSEIVFV